ncbi:MAG: dihydrolipoamide acetyltransferase family protein [Candidatus Woesearchaeota archaeon]
MPYEFKFPDTGEGIQEGEIVKWLVKEGDKVKENDNIVQIETDKAVVDIPSPKTGTILKIYFKEGDTIKVGETLVTIGEKGEKSIPTKSKKSVSVIGELEEAPEEPEEKPKICKPGEPCAEKPQITSQKKDGVKALLRVRRLANKLGTDITKIQGTGVNGNITEDDVINASKGTPTQKTSGTVEKPKIKVAKKYDMWGYIDRVPLKGVRKTIANNLIKSYTTAVHVTSMIDIDITKLWDLREKEKIKAEKQGVKLTLFPYIIKAVIEGLKKHPYLNASLQEDEILLKKYYSIGIAVDTEVGLMVPVLKRAETKSLYDIAKEIVELVTKANERKLDLMDLKGGSFTITNYGSIGGNYGTPIINPPESAILGLGRAFDRTTFINDKIKNIKILPLSLTFDHRILDGAEAARFLNTVKEYLESPEKIKKEGDK